jgi:hypothetical protein
LNGESADLLLNNIINPFSNILSFDIAVTADGPVEAVLLSTSGLIMKKESFTAHNGINYFALNDLQSLPSALYILQIRYKDKLVVRKVMKN